VQQLGCFLMDAKIGFGGAAAVFALHFSRVERLPFTR